MKTHRPCVLLVDDYPDALEMWRALLSMSGYDVETATDGEEAVRKALATKPDLIVMDLELPVTSGIEAARRLRAMPATSSIPLIAATGQATLGYLAAAQAVGFDALLLKPCDPGRLLDEIERILDVSGYSVRREGGHHSPANG